MKKRKIMTALLWGTMVLWLAVIYGLSTQNGEQTAQTSMTLTKKLAVLVYQNPTDAQISELHMILRKFAHMFLFFVLGFYVTVISAVTFPKRKGIFRGYYLIVDAAFTAGCGYFDEWHKQFIDGRHFDYSEVLLNVRTGILGVAAALVVVLVCRLVRSCMEKA